MHVSEWMMLTFQTTDVQRESTTKACFDSDPAGMCPTTSSRDYFDVLQSRRHDVTELPVTSARRCVDNDEQASLDNNQPHRLHHPHHPHYQQQQQQQQPTSTQYISDTCVLLTYFTGDIESNVDEHFARALSRPSSFDPDCQCTILPSVHTGISVALRWKWTLSILK